MKLPRSPLAPQKFPYVKDIQGVTFKTGTTGQYYSGRMNLLMVIFEDRASVAGTLTGSKTASAPVVWCRDHLPKGYARALVVNAGNANVFTGKHGEAVVHNTAHQAASLLGCQPQEIFIASTGIIGKAIHATEISDSLPALLDHPVNATWEQAATAIMTTDTFPKASSVQTTIDHIPVSISGIAKGSGMIAPNMATMFAFLFSDVNIVPSVLQEVVSRNVEKTFNAITVDGDTSTSDTVLFFATRKASHLILDNPTDPRLIPFEQAVYDMMFDLAQQIICDGEGAQKHVTIVVRGAQDDKSARRIGLSIANSPLVKTAIAGSDPNWGRIVMAIGKVDEPVERDRIGLEWCGIPVLEKGQVVSSYDPETLRTLLKGTHIMITVNLGLENGQATVWTCDLTHGYIDINAHYTTS